MSDVYQLNEYLVIYRPTSGKFADEICISAHGGYEKKFGWASPPNAATICFYELHGSTQMNQKSRQIMQGYSNVSPTSIGCGSVWNYHLAPYELDSEQAPSDVGTSAMRVDLDRKKEARGQETFGFKLRDVLSIRDEKLPKNLFPNGVSLQYIFDELGDVHSFAKMHICFCRYQLGYRGNLRGKATV